MSLHAIDVLLGVVVLSDATLAENLAIASMLTLACVGEEQLSVMWKDGSWLAERFTVSFHVTFVTSAP